MAIQEEASPICRGKNLSWETVMLFYNYMPKSPMPKNEFHQFVEKNISSWTTTHSQVARQLAFYYEIDGICYPRFNEKSTLVDLFAYMEHWGHNYFIPNPYAPSLKGLKPTCIYSYIIDKINQGETNFDKAIDSMFDRVLSSHDKLKVYLGNFTNIFFDGALMKINHKINDNAEILSPTDDAAKNPKAYFDYFNIKQSDIRTEFDFYLRYCINSSRRSGNQFRYGDSAVASYMSYMKADVLFAHDRNSWSNIKESLFEITTIEEIDKICDNLLKNSRFVEFDEQRGQWGIKTLMIYNAFLHARDYFAKKIIQTSSIETTDEKDEKDSGVSTNLVAIISGESENIGNYLSYVTAIKSKPFLLLAGISGTGKSRIVRELARACWNPSTEEGKEQRKDHKPRNYELIQVKPNWHDSSELIGYESRLDGGRFIVGPFLKFIVKAMQDPDRPYFLCLDEMNLAPVEQYFAEYLSVLETRKLQDGKIITDPIIDKSVFNKKYAEGFNIFDELGLARIPRTQSINESAADGVETSSEEFDRQDIVEQIKKEGLRIPRNLIVVGTVNMDETTYGFSRKVLDRAMTIEMNEVDLRAGLDEESMEMPYIKAECFIPDCVEGKDVYSSYTSKCDEVIEYLEKINNELENTPFKIAYRTRNEFLVYVVNALRLASESDDKNLVIAKALDEITCMKVLSRIEGDKRRVGEMLSEDHLQKVVNEMKDGYKDKISDESAKEKLEEYELISVAKLKHMQEKLNGGYTDFWD